MEFKEIVQKRYAVKKFNGEIIPDDKIEDLLEIIRFAPSSSNVQPWKILVITNKEMKEKLLSASYNQLQITTCSHLLVFCADSNVLERVDELEKLMVESGVSGEKAKAFNDMTRGAWKGKREEDMKNWAQRQLYIALGNAVNGAKALGFDSCPMEGFLPEEYSKILDLPGNIVPTALVTVGFASDEPREKIRFRRTDVFEWV